MKEYLVRWEVQVAADSPREAARLAQVMQRDPASLATVFEVLEVAYAQNSLWVDLAEPEEGR